MTGRRCAGGGRPLRVSRGLYGPVCARRLGLTTTTRPQAAPRLDHPADPIPGQTALPLTPMQPTLWSL